MTYNSDGSQPDVQAKINLSVDGDTVTLPTGTFHWTSITCSKGITMSGNSTIDTTTASGTATDNTIIIDDGTTSTQTINVVLTANQTFRMTGLTFQRGTNTLGANQPGILISGICPGATGTGSVRVDHCHFDDLHRNNELQIAGWIYGVVDHCIFHCQIDGAFGMEVHHDSYGTFSGTAYGDGSWADFPNLGSSKFLFIENNCFNNDTTNGAGPGGVDSKYGARFVARYNFLNNVLIGNHGTEGGRPRGGRIQEIYNNTTSYTFSFPTAYTYRSGTGVVHDNTVLNLCHGLGNVQAYRIFQNFGAPYDGANGTNAWDSNDPFGAYASGTNTGATSASTIVDSTKTWAPNQWQTNSSSGFAYVVKANTQNWLITSNTANSLTLLNYAGRQVANGDAYTIYKVLRVIDQPGSGKGNLVIGANPAAAFPNNAIEPIYVWGNTVQNPNFSGLGMTAPLMEGRDVCNQSAGNVHVGLLSARPPTASLRQAYFATDHGSQGTLYICTATNTWSTDGDGITYTPYIYPHPLTVGLAVAITSPVNGNFVSGTVTLSATASTSNNFSVAGVQFKLDGSNLGSEDTTAPYSVPWLTTSAINGSHTISAVARDTGGNTTAATITVSVNNTVTPSVISGVNTSGVIDTAATVNWTTDVASDSQVSYGTTTAYGTSTTLNTSLVTSHSQVLTGLSAGTTYHFQVKSKDSVGNIATSGDFMFTTSTGADTTAPTVSITSPGAGTVSGSTTVTATASDNIGVVGVQFQLDAVTLGSEVLASPYTMSWDTKSATNGSHTLTAIARDAAGNKTTSAGVVVTVSNSPIISGVGVSGITVTGATINWTTNQSSDSQVDYGLTTGYGSSSTLNSNLLITHLVDLTGLTPNTTYHFRVKSRDAQTLLTTSGDFQFTTAADTTAPTVSITAPTAAATVSGTAVTVSASASDDVGVISVQFLVDGVNIGLDSVSPFSITWDTTGLINGTHVLTAVAKDGANNQTTSATVSVTVSNPPIISAVTTSAISSTGATIQWTTNRASDSKINYGVTSGYGINTTLDSTLVTSHSQTVTGLTPSTNYHFAVLSRDAQTNLTTSSDFIFQTTASGGDTTPPTISMTAPPNSTIVGGSVVVSASATDNVGVAGVQFKLDGANLGSQVTVSPYSILWNTRQSTDGSHTVGAVATDTSGNTASAATVTVTVSNAIGGKGRKKKLLI